MLRARDTIAIDFGRRRLRAVLASEQGRRVLVRRTLSAEAPADVDVRDPARLGAWIGRELRSAGFPRGRAVVSLAREHVGLKRMTLPSTDAEELPRMTRLALQRELPFEADDAIIDFVPVERTDTSTTVLAVAVPGQMIDFMKRTIRAAGLRVERIDLRTMGAARLGEPAKEEDGDTLVIDVTGEGIEFCVLRDGAIRFSRAAETSGDAETILTETRRTWMSFRIVEETGGLRRAVVLGERSRLGATAEAIGHILHVPVDVLDHHPRIESKMRLDQVWPLAGLMLAPPAGDETIDFARPRRAPDRAARRRRHVVLAAGVLLVVIAGLWTMGRRERSALEDELATLVEMQKRLAPQRARYFRDRYRLAHLEGWETAQIEWLPHAAYVTTMAPDADKIVFDSWTGTLAFPGVKFDRQRKTWEAPRRLTIVIDGDARDRATADAFREALVGADMYTTSSSGADAESGRRLPYGFTYRLQTEAAAPPEPTLLGEARP